ncbi:MAG: hypothetical protein AAGU12_09060 [Clostridiales bacterium]
MKRQGFFFLVALICLGGICGVVYLNHISNSAPLSASEKKIILIKDFFERPEEYQIIWIETNEDITEKVFQKYLEWWEKEDFTTLTKFYDQYLEGFAIAKAPKEIRDIFPPPPNSLQAVPNEFFIFMVTEIYSSTDAKPEILKETEKGNEDITEQFIKDNQKNFDEGDFQAIQNYVVEHNITTLNVEGALYKWQEERMH